MKIMSTNIIDVIYKQLLQTFQLKEIFSLISRLIDDSTQCSIGVTIYETSLGDTPILSCVTNWSPNATAILFDLTKVMNTLLLCIFFIDKHFLLMCYYFVQIIVN